MTIKYNCFKLTFYKSYWYFIGLISALALSGCVNYLGIKSQKKLASPFNYSTKHSIPKQNGIWPTNNWAQQFGDPQLALLIKEALTNNPDLKTAQARIVQARALAESRLSVLLPNATLQAEIIRGKLSANLVPPILGGGKWFTLSAFLSRINYDVDIWGKNLASFRQALAQAKASEIATQEASLTLATSLASTYNQLAYYYALRHILHKTIQQRKALNTIALIRLKSGLDTEVQLNLSRNTIANAQTQLALVAGEIVLRRQQLGVLLGGGPDRGLSIKNPQLKYIKTPPLPANLPLHLLGRRPDIVGASWKVEATSQGIKQVKAQFYPDINIAALAGFLSLNTNRLFTSASTQFQAGPALNLPIFDNGNLRAQLKGQYGLYEEAVAHYNAILNNALAEVAAHIATIHSLEQQLRIQTKALSSAARAYNVARYQYRTGLASQLVVLDAETLYLRAQQERLQLLTNKRITQIALIKALGGGFHAS